MKKTIFTFSAIAIVCGAIFFACKKDDNSAIHVGYAPQIGTGTNPDPNHTNTTSGATTTGTTTTSGSTTSTTGSTTPTSTTTTHFSVDGVAASNLAPSGIPGSSTFSAEVYDGSGSPNVIITFPGTTAPASGTYIITNGTPAGNQCSFVLNGSLVAASGIVIVTAGSPNTCTFNNITAGTHTVTGTIKY